METVKGDNKVMLLEAFTKDTGIRLGIETRREYTWWLEQQLVKNLTIPVVSHRTFTPNCIEVEDMAVQIDQFINQHALAKPGTYSRKLREFLANKLNEYGG